MKKINWTSMFVRYMIKFAFRVLIFLTTLFLYLFHKDQFAAIMNQPIWQGITPIHGLWLIFMVMMIRHLFPGDILTMALLKSEKRKYAENAHYSEMGLYRFVQDQNSKAWKVMLIWLSFNAIFGFLYLIGIMDDVDLVMLSVFYFLCDYICILFFCPFQTFIMKNKCCVNCRIYDWGHFMMFTPMLFIRNFFSWSLFFTSVVVLIHWEMVYVAHPERFWYGSNKVLQCINCNDKTCQIKKRVNHFILKK